MKKIFSIMVVSLVFLLLGCDQDITTEVNDDFSYYEQNLSNNEDYNTDLYYLNSLDFQMADPSVIYITEGDEEGYFYAYGTSDDIRVFGFQSWRSKDLTHWESMGIAFKPDFNETWADINYWAPEVIYDEEDGLYYLFYSAQTTSDDTFQMSVAYAEEPYGPFITPDGFRNGDGYMLSASKPVYNLKNNNTGIDPDIVRLNAIDASPFIDPVTGDKYLYFSYFDSFNQSEIFGMKMKDWFTPDYSTLKQLTAVGYLSVEAAQNSDVTQTTPEGTINEGPFMLYHDGRYYLTLSVYGFTDEKYQVRQALGDDPLGTFNKILPEEGGTVLATDPSWSHITSAGHHVFVYVGDDIYIAYHTFYNRTDITDGRALAFDKVEFVDYNGVPLLHSNGPTHALQPLPEQISGYTNIAPSADVSATNTLEDSDVAYLVDGVMSYLAYDSIPEYKAGQGVSKITLTWDEFVTARAIMIYNSTDYDDSFIAIDKIQLSYLKDDDGSTGLVEMTDLQYDWDWHVDSTFNQMNPGGAIVTEFADLSINKIEITLSSIIDSNIGIPEIIVLGHEVSSGPSQEFLDYQYENPEFKSPDLVIEGTTIGSVEGLNTNFGYDLSHDDGTEDAYIIQNWVYDQFAYFKDVYSTSFYVEAEFTVTNDQSYANDPFPKFGLTVATTENTIFYFVDADPNYTRDAVGVAQRTFDNSDWDWNTTEQNVLGTGISYKNGNYVKMAIIRDGDEFYMLVNDELVIYYDNFNIFVEDYPAAVGFLTFNTEIKIQNYYATDDLDMVEEKKELYVSDLNGHTFGMTGNYKTTSGWDLSTDTDDASAYVESTSPGDQYIYFKDYQGDYFYAETDITAVESLGDPYPKFGIFLRIDDREFFYFIDANPSFTSSRVGYVEKINGDWQWQDAEFFNVSNLSYRLGEYAKLAILRDGSNLSLRLNDVEVTQITDFTESDSVVGILSFTTGVRITNYRLLIDVESISELE